MLNLNNRFVSFKGQMEISAGKEIQLKTPTNDATDRQFLQPFQRLLNNQPDSLKLACDKDTFYTEVGDGTIFCKKVDDNIVINTCNIMPFPFFNFKLTLNKDNTGLQVLSQANNLFDQIITTLKSRYKD